MFKFNKHSTFHSEQESKRERERQRDEDNPLSAVQQQATGKWQGKNSEEAQRTTEIDTVMQQES